MYHLLFFFLQSISHKCNRDTKCQFFQLCHKVYRSCREKADKLLTKINSCLSWLSRGETEETARVGKKEKCGTKRKILNKKLICQFRRSLYLEDPECKFCLQVEKIRKKGDFHYIEVIISSKT